jgi:Uma2 family endonuclease
VLLAGRYNGGEARIEQGACEMAQARQTEIAYDDYVALALAQPDRKWELYRGCLREKPGMSMEHNREQRQMVKQLNRQLDDEYEVCFDQTRLRSPSGDVFIPDVAVVPAVLAEAREGPTRRLETYDEPLPYVVEVWSPSTGDHDVDTKFAEYRARGDEEIWRIHPFERTVIAWRRQADGSYQESLHTGGRLALWSLPHVTIDLDALLR